jgi:hypothetical protein
MHVLSSATDIPQRMEGLWNKLQLDSETYDKIRQRENEGRKGPESRVCLAYQSLNMKLLYEIPALSLLKPEETGSMAGTMAEQEWATLFRESLWGEKLVKDLELGVQETIWKNLTNNIQKPGKQG